MENPSEVVPEFSTQAGRPDYALKVDNRIVAFVGAKALGKLEDTLQYISYCVAEGIPYFITTDGDKWEVYKVNNEIKRALILLELKDLRAVSKQTEYPYPMQRPIEIIPS
ncbi:MAG: hypothetical protein ABIL16_00185 [candidate division WOR-3 bacterium]